MPYVFAGDSEDFSTTGLCGALVPESCEHEEIAGGISAVIMRHPFDPWGKWEHLITGNILQCDVRVRTTPNVNDMGVTVAHVDEYTVKTTATVTQRTVYARKKGTKKKGTLIAGRKVEVLGSYTANDQTRYQIRYEKIKNKKKGTYSWVLGWCNPEALSETFTRIQLGEDGDLESVCPSTDVAPQLFRIRSAIRDTKAGDITVEAVHISCDLEGNVCRFRSDTVLSGVQCLCGDGEIAGIMGSLDFETEVACHTNVGSRRTSASYEDVDAMNALLGEGTGFCERYAAELVRDDHDMFFLTRAGKNSGVRMEYGKNLTGVTYTRNEERMVTAILPVGVNKNGSTLYLTDDKTPGTMANYVMSEYVDDYPVVHAQVLVCADCTVEKGKKGVTLAVARARMREQAEEMFTGEGRVDVPEVTARVSFLELGDTIEYAAYKGLETVFLYDYATVVDQVHGIELTATVQRVRWDCLTERLIEVELGNERSMDAYRWDLERLETESAGVVWLTGGPLRYQMRVTERTEESNPEARWATVENFSETFRIWGTSGGYPVAPEVDAAGATGLQPGMTLTVGEVDPITRALPVTLRVASNSYPMLWPAQEGHVEIPVTSPTETVLKLEYGRYAEEVVVASDVQPDNPAVGTMWTDTSSSAVVSKGIMYPVYQFAEVLDWSVVDAQDVTEGSGTPGPDVETPYYHDIASDDYYVDIGGTWENLEPVASGDAPSAEQQCTVSEGQLSVSQRSKDWLQTNDAQAAMAGNTTQGLYPYFRIDNELGLLIGNAQIVYDPEKGLGVWPYEWSE